jgi:hypothetical protein
MLYGLSKQIAHCYFRAAECRRLADLSVSMPDRQFYIEREQAWLALARSHELSERIDRYIKEVGRRTGRGCLSATRATKSPQCPNCGIDMQFRLSHPTKRAFAGISFERAFFLCPNCQRASEQLVAIPAD